jgi:hypothetical protein
MLASCAVPLPLPRPQVGFLNVVACPMYRLFVSAYPGTQALLDSVEANLRMWQERAAQLAAASAAAAAAES